MPSILTYTKVIIAFSRCWLVLWTYIVSGCHRIFWQLYVEGLIAGLGNNALLVTSLPLPFFFGNCRYLFLSVIVMLYFFNNNGNKFSHYFIITLIQFFIFIFYSVFWIQFLKKSIVFAKKIYSIESESRAVFCSKWRSKYICTYESLLNDICILLFDYLSLMIGQIKDPLLSEGDVLSFSMKNRSRWILMASGFEKFFLSREFWRERKKW